MTILIASPAPAGAAPPAGKAVFEQRCAACHAPGLAHPGTMQLELGRGLADGALENRTDLEAGYVRHVVRHGLGLMPPFRPSELDDATLDALAEYLAQPRPSGSP